MQHQKLELLSKAFASLGHPTKVRLLQYVMDHETDPGDPIVPTMAAAVLEMTVAQAASNLKRLSEVGVLDRQITGRYTFYTVNKTFLETVQEYFR